MAASTIDVSTDPPTSDPTHAAAMREILSDAARAFLTDLHHRFDGRRQALLKARVERQARYDAGELPDFASETATIRDSDWRVAPIPGALADRRGEINRPGGRKMIINPPNFGARGVLGRLEGLT